MVAQSQDSAVATVEWSSGISKLRATVYRLLCCWTPLQPPEQVRQQVRDLASLGGPVLDCAVSDLLPSE